MDCHARFPIRIVFSDKPNRLIHFGKPVHRWPDRKRSESARKLQWRAASSFNKIRRRALGFAAYQLLNKIACSL